MVEFRANIPTSNLKYAFLNICYTKKKTLTDHPAVIKWSFIHRVQKIEIITQARKISLFYCRCIIINDKGFIIVHKDWIEEASESVGKNDIHIAQEESHIAERLIQKDILQAKSCIDIARDFKQSVYWQVHTESCQWYRSAKFPKGDGEAGLWQTSV